MMTIFDNNNLTTTPQPQIELMNNSCDRLNTDELVYHSSEQYLIVCLRICSLILRNKCHISNLIDLTMTMNATDHQNHHRHQDLKRLKKFQHSDDNDDYLLIADDLDFLIDLEQQQHQQQQQQTITATATTMSVSQTVSNNYAPLLFSNLNETECMKYAHKESYKLALFICGIVLCFFIILLNSLTLFTILRSRRLHSITNILIANLSIADFLSGVAFLYPCVLNLLTINALENFNANLYTIACNVRQNYYLCLMGYSPIITSMLCSMLTLTLLALEKYMAILQPYVYERMIDNRKYLCYLMLTLTWLISIMVSLLPIMGWNEHNKYSIYRGFNCMHAKSLPCMFERIFTLNYILLFTSICCVCALAMMGIYARIYLTARKHSKQIARQQKNLQMNVLPSNKSSGSNNQEQQTNIAMSNTKINHHDHQPTTITAAAARRSMKAMKTILILLLGFYACWMPLIVYFLTFASHKFNNLTIYILMFVACCNAVIDPLIYAFRNKKFLRELLQNFKQRRQF